MTNEPKQELTLEDVVLLVKSYFREALRIWWHLLIIGAIVVGIFVYRAWSTPVEYKATFTFMRDADDGGGMGGMASILGQFGLGGRGRGFNLDRVLELAKSRRVVNQAMYDSCTIDGKNDYIANQIIAIYELDQLWAKSTPELEGFRFSHGQLSTMHELELKAAKRVYNFIVGGEEQEGLISAGYSDDSGILSLSATTLNEDLSIELISSVYEHLSNYYITQITAKQRATYEIVKMKSDSIAAELASLEVEYAKFRDKNQSLYSNLSRVREEQLSRNIAKLNIVHAEALKNVEIADFSLRNATPVIRELDIPVKPLTEIKESLLKTAVIGFIVGCIACIFYLVARRLVRVISMVEEKG